MLTVISAIKKVNPDTFQPEIHATITIRLEQVHLALAFGSTDYMHQLLGEYLITQIQEQTGDI